METIYNTPITRPGTPDGGTFMKLHVKLSLTCALLLLFMQIVNALFYYNMSDSFYGNTARDNLSAMGSKIVQQYEDSIRMMDYTLENLLSNVEFMYAMETLAGNNSTQTDRMNAQSVLMRVLYREPLNREYYRVNVFNEQGVFYTSRFENRDTANHLSHDLPQIAASVPWLDTANADPFRSHLISCYRDPWTVSREQDVFGVVRSVVWMGQHVGFMEVQATTDTLNNIFSTGEMQGVRALAVLGNGEILYSSDPSVTDAESLKNNPDDLSMTFRSSAGGMTLTLAQDKSHWQAAMQSFMKRITMAAVLILAVSVTFSTLISFGLTRSVRRMKRRMDDSDFHGDTLALYTPEHRLHGTGDEIAQLETAFDRLISRLNLSIHNELLAQEMHLQARFQALQAQINPHFIYNTLNMLAAKSLQGGSLEMANMCTTFAQMLRYSIDFGQKSATLGEELAHVNNYLELLKARYGDRFAYEIDCRYCPETLPLPRVSLQPLVENSIQHGFKQKTGDMYVSITCMGDGNCTTIAIRDNGGGFPAEIISAVQTAVEQFRSSRFDSLSTDVQAQKVGLMNVLARMMYLCEQQMDVRIYNDDGAVIELIFFGGEKEGN